MAAGTIGVGVPASLRDLGILDGHPNQGLKSLAPCLRPFGTPDWLRESAVPHRPSPGISSRWGSGESSTSEKRVRTRKVRPQIEVSWKRMAG